MASGEARKRKQEEYEMQLFGLHSRAVYATLRDIVYDRIKSNAEQLCKSLENTYKLNSEQLEVLRNNKKQIMKAYVNGAIPHLQNIESYANKFIAVPDNVLLEEDKCQRVQYTAAEFANMKQNLEDLLQRAKRAVILNTVLKEELQLQKQLEEHEGDIKKMCNIVEQGYACPSTNSDLSDFAIDFKKFTKQLHDPKQMAQQKPSKISDKQHLYKCFDNLHSEDVDVDSL